MEYNKIQKKVYHPDGSFLSSFIDVNHQNIDLETVESFGQEWSKFDNFSEKEIENIGNDYFDVVPWHKLGNTPQALDVGCGTGRWAVFASDKVEKVEAIDPSEAVWSAVKLLKDKPNVRISIADVDRIPFEDNSFDLVYSLGVLHHIPDTFAAMKQCARKVKTGGFFLIYLYYNLDNRGLLYRSIFKMSHLLRKIISRFPPNLKRLSCDILAFVLYLPFITLSWSLEKIGLNKIAKQVPLTYYRKTTWNIIRNDALDRFGTPLEQRFSKQQIHTMMSESGLSNIVFSNHAPYWHAIGQKI